MRRLTVLLLVLSAFAAPVARATFAGENGRVFYTVAPYSDSSAIQSACPGGTHVKTVANLAFLPAPSPDGKRVAYNKLVKYQNTQANDGIWVANADGSDPVQLADKTLSPIGPAWSPDGKKLTFRQYVPYAGYESRLQPVVMDLATKVITPLLSDRHVMMKSAGVAAPSWTPDGASILFPGNIDDGPDDLYLVPAGGGTAQRILGDDNTLPSAQRVDLSPDGTRFLEQHVSSFDPVTNETWSYPFGGGAGMKLLQYNQSTGAGDAGAAFSPDGKKIIFSRNLATTLMTADADGTDVVPFGNNTSGSYAAWSVNTDDCTDPGAATMRINEVGTGGAPFVELLDPADETFPDAQGPYRVVVYDGAGARQGAHAVSSALLQGRDNTKPLLLSSATADAAYGVTGDEPLSEGLPSPGQACFTKGAGETKLDCVAWGCVANPITATATRIPAPGTGTSSQRQGIGSTTFHLATPTPKAANVAGAATVACPAPAPAPDAVPSGTPVAPVPSSSPKPTATTVSPKPAVTVQTRSGKVKAGAVTVPLSCSGTMPCAGTATLTAVGSIGAARTAKTITFGSRRFKIAAGRSAKVKIKLTGAARKRIRRTKRLKARLTVRLTGAAPVKRTFTLRR